MDEIYRILFLSLNRDKKYPHHYIILIDGWFKDEMWADNDDDAIRQLTEMRKVS